MATNSILKASYWLCEDEGLTWRERWGPKAGERGEVVRAAPALRSDDRLRPLSLKQHPIMQSYKRKCWVGFLSAPVQGCRPWECLKAKFQSHPFVYVFCSFILHVSYKFRHVCLIYFWALLGDSVTIPLFPNLSEGIFRGWKYFVECLFLVTVSYSFKRSGILLSEIITNPSVALCNETLALSN